MTAYNALRTSGCFNSDANTATLASSAKALLQGKAAMVAQFDTAFITELQADNPDAANLIGFTGVSAAGPTLTYTPNLTGTYYVPNTGNSAKERAATDFINWITGPGYPAYVKDSDAHPTLSGVATPAQSGIYTDVAAAYNGGSAFCYLTDMPAATALGPLALQVLAGQASPQDVGNKMNVAFQAAQKQLG